MKFGDQVIFIENGKQYSATVLSERVLDHHLGENDEPLLQLGFFAPVLAPAGKSELNVVGTARANELVQFRADVAHESHEFGAAAAEANLSGIYPGGRWREVGAVVVPEAVPVEDGAMLIAGPGSTIQVEGAEDKLKTAEEKPEGEEP